MLFTHTLVAIRKRRCAARFSYLICRKRRRRRKNIFSVYLPKHRRKKTNTDRPINLFARKHHAAMVRCHQSIQSIFIPVLQLRSFIVKNIFSSSAGVVWQKNMQYSHFVHINLLFNGFFKNILFSNALLTPPKLRTEYIFQSTSRQRRQFSREREKEMKID